MKKRQIIETLKQEYQTLKKEDASHQLIVLLNGKKVYVKIVNISANAIFSFNSKTVWEIKKGKISGIRFIQTSSTFLKTETFMDKTDKVIIFTTRPYKILRQINEADIEDVSEQAMVNGVLVISEPLMLNKLL